MKIFSFPPRSVLETFSSNNLLGLPVAIAAIVGIAYVARCFKKSGQNIFSSTPGTTSIDKAEDGRVVYRAVEQMPSSSQEQTCAFKRFQRGLDPLSFWPRDFWTQECFLPRFFTRSVQLDPTLTENLDPQGIEEQDPLPRQQEPLGLE